MEAEDDGITRFGANQGFKHGGGGGIGDGGYAGHDADRLRNLHIAFHLVLLNDTYAFLIFDRVPDILGGEEVLDDFVLIDAATCLLIGELGQTDVIVVAGNGHGMDNFIHLFLIHFHVLVKSPLRLDNQIVDHFLDIDFLAGGFLRRFGCSHVINLL